MIWERADSANLASVGHRTLLKQLQRKMTKIKDKPRANTKCVEKLNRPYTEAEKEIKAAEVKLDEEFASLTFEQVLAQENTRHVTAGCEAS